MPKIIDPVDALREFVARYPTQNDAAEALEISAAYLSDMLRNNRRMSDVILDKLGLTRVVVKE